MTCLGLAPAEFWRLHPVEFWWLVDARRPQKRYGSLSEREVASLYDDLLAAQAQERAAQPNADPPQESH